MAPAGEFRLSRREHGREGRARDPGALRRPDTPRCGDGLVTRDEQCDSTNLLEDSLRRLPGNSHRTSTTSCTLLGKGSGPLRCGSDGRYDTSACVVPASCGNGQVDEGEICDGSDVARASCSSEGFSDGQLHCRADCQLNVNACRMLLQ